MNNYFLRSTFLFLSLLTIYFCDEPVTSKSENYRLTSKPGDQTLTVKPGINYFDFGDLRNCILYIPSDYSEDKLSPLFIGLHGAGGSALSWSEFFEIAETRGMIFLAIDSYSYTWDFINSFYGQDVEFIDKALAYTFNRCQVDPNHIALGGFSDGASYALSLGLLNGDLFSHILAYSPGFIDQSYHFIGKPKIYITHGREDNILPISNSKEIMLPFLEDEGYEVTFREHDGGHELTSSIFDFAMDWFLK